MTADANDPLSRAILEYLYELTRTLAGTHWQETIGGWIAVNLVLAVAVAPLWLRRSAPARSPEPVIPSTARA
jgi:hypothetical protein